MEPHSLGNRVRLEGGGPLGDADVYIMLMGHRMVGSWGETSFSVH